MGLHYMNLIILIIPGNRKIVVQTENLQHEFCQYYNNIYKTMDVGKGFLNFTRIVCNLLSIIVRQIMHQTLSISISNAFIKDTYLRSLYISPWISLFCNLSKFFFNLKVLFPFCGVKKKNVINVFMLFLLEINITNYAMIKWSLIEMTYFVC